MSSLSMKMLQGKDWAQTKYAGSPVLSGIAQGKGLWDAEATC